MPNFKVFSDVPSQLLAQVSQPTAASLLAQVSNATPASLLAQVSNLTAACLLVQTAVGTTEVNTDVADTGDTTFKTAVVQNVLAWDKVTFTVRNSGTSNSAVCRLQLSADSVLFTNDPTAATATIGPTDQFFFVPGVFTKYAQIQYSSETTALTTSLSVIFQAQG